MSVFDPRMKAAAEDPVRGRQLLTELHTQILSVRDLRQFTDLLSRYTALATTLKTRQEAARSRVQDMSAAFNLLSSISKAMHDQAMKAIQNMKG